MFTYAVETSCIFCDGSMEVLATDLKKVPWFHLLAGKVIPCNYRLLAPLCGRTLEKFHSFPPPAVPAAVSSLVQWTETSLASAIWVKW